MPSLWDTASHSAAQHMASRWGGAGGRREAGQATTAITGALWLAQQPAVVLSPGGTQGSPGGLFKNTGAQAAFKIEDQKGVGEARRAHWMFTALRRCHRTAGAQST